MTTVIFIIVGLVAGFGLAFLIFKSFGVGKGGEKGQDNSAMLLLQNQLNTLIKTVDDKLGESARHMQTSIQNQFSESSKIIRDVTERLTKLDETNRQVVGFADQLQSLQDILKNPKQRGILGEYYLETLLKNVLPPGSYQMQYPFPDGTIVDAVVFVRDKIIPIDSKFSLENYNRLVEEKNPAEKEKLEKTFVGDLKNRITETAKYVQPDKGTMEFAFMFIPHEAIYYDLIINKIGALKDENTENLIQRAASKYHVIIVSPTSFLAYLQTVLQGLKALQIEESAKEIRQRVEELGKHLGAYEGYMAKLGGALGTSVSHYNLAYKELKKVDKDVMRVTGASAGIELQTIDKPSLDD
jgi:DNA recombination protein RmuC